MRQSLLFALASFAFVFALPTPQGYDYDKSNAPAKEGTIPAAPSAEHAGIAPVSADKADTQDAPVSKVPSSVDDATESTDDNAHSSSVPEASQDLDAPATGTNTQPKKVIVNLKHSNLPADDAPSDSVSSGAVPNTGNGDVPSSKSNLDNASPALSTSLTAPPNFGSAEKDLAAPTGGADESGPDLPANLQTTKPSGNVGAGVGVHAGSASFAPAGGIGAGRPFATNDPHDPASSGLPQGGGIPSNSMPPQGPNVHSGSGRLPPPHGTDPAVISPPSIGSLPPYGIDPSPIPPSSGGSVFPPPGGVQPSYGTSGVPYDPAAVPPSGPAFPPAEGVRQLYPGGPASPYWPPAAGIGPVLSGGAGFRAGYGGRGAVPVAY